MDIGDVNPVSLFGGRSNSAAIDSNGFIICIDRSSAKTALIHSLPNAEKATSVACCDDFIYVLSASGKVFKSKSGLNMSFEEVSELKGKEIICISGIREHCFAVTNDGKVFGVGDNFLGRIGIGNKKLIIPNFTEIPSLNKYKIAAVYAGSFHSIFQTQEGKLFACGDNRFGQLINGNMTPVRSYEPVETTVTNASFCIAACDSTIVFKNYVPLMCPNRRNKIKNKINKNLKKCYRPRISNIDQPPKTVDDISALKAKIDTLEQQLVSERKKFEDQLSMKDKEIASLKDEQRNSIKLPKDKKIEILDEEAIRNLEKIEKISSGNFGKVYKVAKKIIYALKVLKKEVTFEEFQQFLKEYEILCLFDHPNILKAFGIFLSNENNPPSILLEFCPSNVEEAIKKKSFSNVEIAFVIYQIAEGMKYVHFQKVIHRDLKPSNILIASDGTIKIGDFGISKLMSAEQQSMTAGVGTQKFMAPEIIDENDVYNEKVDVYSFGVVLFFILSGGDLPKIKMSDKLKGKKADLPQSFTHFSKNLISSCWNFDSNERPSFDQICLEIEKNCQNVISLTDSEQAEINAKIKDHKEKIPKY